jgi:hypothetical protein
MMDHPIERYLRDLSRYLPGSASERATLLEEIRGHLEEKAAMYSAQNMDHLAAEQAAVEAFGQPRRLARQFAAVQPASWGIKRSLSALLLGGAVAWLLWTATAFPLQAENEITLFERGGTISSPLHILSISIPLGSDSLLMLLNHWLLPVLLLYLAPPFLWGKSARSWWLPGLAYGLGTVITNPWPYVLLFDHTSEPAEYYTAGLLVLSALPLALVAAGLGALWQRAQGRIIIREYPHLTSPILPPLQIGGVPIQGPPSTAVRLFHRSISLKWLVLVLVSLVILLVQVVSFLRLWAVM